MLNADPGPIPSATGPRVAFLGPQRFRPTLKDTMRSLGVEGTVAVITAGWQERESEDSELREHLGCEVVDLLLYHRADDAMVRDRELAAAVRERQERLKRLQNLYRLRLGYALEAARELMRRSDRDPMLEEQLRGAIRAVRTLDRQHLRRLRAYHDEWEGRWQPAGRAAVARHRDQIGQSLAGAAVLAVAGGHVAVLVNRMRLFGLASLLGAIPVVAWSAGAMAVSERVVLFHDSPPQGAGNPEVFEAGLGLGPRIVPLPHAHRRLQLDDATGVALFARRFSPDTCVVLDEGARVDWDGERWVAAAGTRQLGLRGRVREMSRS